MFEFENMCKAFEEMANGERKLYLQEQSVKLIDAFDKFGSDGIQMFLYFIFFQQKYPFFLTPACALFHRFHTSKNRPTSVGRFYTFLRCPDRQPSPLHRSAVPHRYR